LKTYAEPEYMPDVKPLYSFHAFIFPFEWKPTKKDGLLLEKQTDLQRICPVMDAAKDKWKRMKPWLNPETLVQYNEANYFYDFVRPVLYGDGGGNYQVYYQHEEAEGGSYNIYLHDGTKFSLELDSIGLSFYSSGVGILSFHCYNRAYQDSTEILKINQFGRRVYPPFFSVDTANIGTQAFFDDKNWLTGLEGAKGAELAQAIVLLKPAGQALASEDFDSRIGEGIAPDLKATPGLLKQLLPPALFSNHSISPVLDDRMFVVCWYGNDELSTKMATTSFDAEPEQNDWWYQFVFVDGGFRTCRNAGMVKTLLENHTNLRWQDQGTVYGVSRYSFVCLSQTFAKNSFTKVLCSHMQTHYYKLAELALLQRGCVLRFSDEVTAISDLPEKNSYLGAHVSSLYKQYIRFVNKIYFREVTAQEQGIELYDLLQTHMRLSDHVKSLDDEIGELHNYAMLLEEDRRNEQLDILSYIGAFFVVPSFVVSYLGVPDKYTGQTAVVYGILCIGASLLFFGIIKVRGFWRWVCMGSAIGLMLFILFYAPIIIQKD